MVVVREATAEDLAAAKEVSVLAHASLRRVYRSPKAAYKRIPDLSRVVALVDNRVVGTVQYHAIEDRLHLVGLAVHPDHQRRGVARALIAHLSRLLPQMHLSRLSLYTIKETGNIHIFERLGFRAVMETADELSESVGGHRLTEVYMERTNS